MLKYIQDILAPKKCYGCGISGHFFCPLCQQNVSTHSPICYISKAPSQDFCTYQKHQTGKLPEQVLIYAHYHDPLVSKVIRQAKFYHKKEIWYEISHLYTGLIQKHVTDLGPDTLIAAVPLSRAKKWMRGYNQSQIIAEQVSRDLDVSLYPHLLKKSFRSVQSHLSASQRRKNIQDAFFIPVSHRGVLQGKTVILIDDVIATGSTCFEISRLLKSYGAKHVIVCCFASD